MNHARASTPVISPDQPQRARARRQRIRKRPTAPSKEDKQPCFAKQCEVAARNAPTEKQRAELEKMGKVWQDFEEIIRRGGNRLVYGKIKGWM
jgi:hypothetical protein